MLGWKKPDSKPMHVYPALVAIWLIKQTVWFFLAFIRSA
jgi:hypothetical protein